MTAEFIVRERRGFPILRCPDPLPDTPEAWDRFLGDGSNRVAEAPQPGQAVLLFGLTGLHRAIVDDPCQDGSLSARSDQSLWFLSYDEEDKCWVCWGGANLKGLSKLEITR